MEWSLRKLKMRTAREVLEWKLGICYGGVRGAADCSVIQVREIYFKQKYIYMHVEFGKFVVQNSSAGYGDDFVA